MPPSSLRSIVASPRCVAGGVLPLAAVAGRSTSPRGMACARLVEVGRPARRVPSASVGRLGDSAFGQRGGAGHAPHLDQGQASGQGASGTACGGRPCPNTALKWDWLPAGFARFQPAP